MDTPVSMDIFHDWVWMELYKFQCKRWGDSRSKIGKIENQYGWIVFFSFFFFFSLQFMHIELNFCVCRIIRNSTSIFIFCQTHVSVFSPSIAPPILQDPFGWRVSNDQHSVIHHVRTTNFVIVDSFAVNQNRSYDWKKKKRENIERERKRGEEWRKGRKNCGFMFPILWYCAIEATKYRRSRM